MHMHFRQISTIIYFNLRSYTCIWKTTAVIVIKYMILPAIAVRNKIVEECKFLIYLPTMRKMQVPLYTYIHIYPSYSSNSSLSSLSISCLIFFYSKLIHSSKVFGINKFFSAQSLTIHWHQMAMTKSKQYGIFPPHSNLIVIISSQHKKYIGAAWVARVQTPYQLCT